mmetsp:Transcript_52436/g.97066  ORF Transcript_52436/g.97066 Transcript_52436/m.97066 type:complete len:255 (+) Transcript_52436:311-1075(+)
MSRTEFTTCTNCLSCTSVRLDCPLKTETMPAACANRPALGLTCLRFCSAFSTAFLLCVALAVVPSPFSPFSLSQLAQRISSKSAVACRRSSAIFRIRFLSAAFPFKFGKPCTSTAISFGKGLAAALIFSKSFFTFNKFFATTGSSSGVCSSIASMPFQHAWCKLASRSRPGHAILVVCPRNRTAFSATPKVTANLLYSDFSCNRFAMNAMCGFTSASLMLSLIIKSCNSPAGMSPAPCRFSKMVIASLTSSTSP